MELSLLEELLADTQEADSVHEYPIIEQFGPLRRFDREMRCASRGCGSSTFFKVCGIPRCMIHALRELNEMLVGDVERIDVAAAELVKVAGRPEALWWENLNDYERESWREITKTVLSVYHGVAA